MSSPDLVPASPLSSIDEAPIPVHLDLAVDGLDDDIESDIHSADMELLFRTFE
jgi:hypothetical protein